MRALVVHEHGADPRRRGGLAGAEARRGSGAGRDGRGRAEPGRPGDRLRALLRLPAGSAVRRRPRGHGPRGRGHVAGARHPRADLEGGRLDGGAVRRRRGRPVGAARRRRRRRRGGRGIAGVAGWYAVQTGGLQRTRPGARARRVRHRRAGGRAGGAAAGREPHRGGRPRPLAAGACRGARRRRGRRARRRRSRGDLPRRVPRRRPGAGDRPAVGPAGAGRDERSPATACGSSTSASRPGRRSTCPPRRSAASGCGSSATPCSASRSTSWPRPTRSCSGTSATARSQLDVETTSLADAPAAWERQKAGPHTKLVVTPDPRNDRGQTPCCARGRGSRVPRTVPGTVPGSVPGTVPGPTPAARESLRFRAPVDGIVTGVRCAALRYSRKRNSDGACGRRQWVLLIDWW